MNALQGTDTLSGRQLGQNCFYLPSQKWLTLKEENLLPFQKTALKRKQMLPKTKGKTCCPLEAIFFFLRRLFRKGKVTKCRKSTNRKSQKLSLVKTLGKLASLSILLKPTFLGVLIFKDYHNLSFNEGQPRSTECSDLLYIFKLLC